MATSTDPYQMLENSNTNTNRLQKNKDIRNSQRKLNNSFNANPLKKSDSNVLNAEDEWSAIVKFQADQELQDIKQLEKLKHQ